MISITALAITSFTTTLLRWNWLQRTTEAAVLLWILILLMTGSVVLTAGSFMVSGFNLLSGVRESLLEVLLKNLCNLPAAMGVSISVIGYSYFVLFGVIGGIVYLLHIPAGDN